MERANETSAYKIIAIVAGLVILGYGLKLVAMSIMSHPVNNVTTYYETGEGVQ